jgi:hypothetical protein
MSLFGAPLELYVGILNLCILGVIMLWYFYFKNITKHKILYIWISILFLLNFFTMRLTLKNYLINSEVLGEQGLKGNTGAIGKKGSDRCCSNNETIIVLKNKADEWSSHIINYKQGVNFLKNYFYVDKSMDKLLSKDRTSKFQETENPFNKIKIDNYWKIKN